MWTNIYNLADGHAWQSLGPGQVSIVENLGSIFQQVASSSFVDLEAHFINTFFEVAQQHTAITSCSVLLSPSASYSIDVAAAFFGEQRWSVALIEPCFSHIAMILNRRGAHVKSISESTLSDENIELILANLNIQVLFLCSPNNPTGFELDQVSLARIANACRINKIMLVIDRAYGLFSCNYWDRYKVLQEACVKFIVIEDTGKVWPALDLKVGILVSDLKTCNKLRLIQDETLLHVSPFVLAMLIEYLKDTSKNGTSETVSKIVDINRKMLRTRLIESSLKPITQSSISAEWMEISTDKYNSLDIIECAKAYGVLLLAGDFFYWSNRSYGRRYVRIALMRDPGYFNSACDRLTQALQNL